MAFDANEIATAAARPLPRTMDATDLNAVANEPATRLAMGAGTGPLDFGALLEDPANVAFADERGGFLFHNLGSRRFELHTLLKPHARGSEALALAAHAIRAAFVETECVELVTRVPGNLRHADLMARRAGFREVWTMAGAWPGPEGQRVPLRLFSLTLDEWMMRDPTLVTEGEAFHALLLAARDAAGDSRPLHPNEDETHERAAGMAALMAKAGNTHKACWAYGRWAVLAGYRPVELLSENPAVYDVGQAIVQARNGALEVLKWLPQQ